MRIELRKGQFSNNENRTKERLVQKQQEKSLGKVSLEAIRIDLRRGEVSNNEKRTKESLVQKQCEKN